MLRIWYDACTGKHVRYGAALTERLRKKGCNVIFTLRDHPDTVPLAEYLSLKFSVIGRYDPTSRFSRLYESLMRQIEFCKMFKEPPDIAVSHTSVDLCRVAFGLGIPIILTFDTPHGDAQSRLTVPLSDVVVASKAIPEDCLRMYGARKISFFNGVDEVAWMRSFKPLITYNFRRPLIVVRQVEIKAAYAEDLTDETEKLAEKLTSLGNVVFLSRYDRKPRKGLIVPEGFIDSASLAAQADLVISAGGTISREAALAGTPSIVIRLFGRIYVNDYLVSKGFPIFTVKPEEVMRYAEKYLGKRFDVRQLVDGLEDPVDIVEDIIRDMR